MLVDVAAGSFFFNDTAPTEIYTLSLHDALPIYGGPSTGVLGQARREGFEDDTELDRKSTRLNSSHLGISYAVFCLKKKQPHSARRRRAGTPRVGQRRRFRAHRGGMRRPYVRLFLNEPAAA